jgi:hypothetical protein
MGYDYGLGVTNVDVKTNIRYGVIPVDEILQTWSDSEESVYSEGSEEDFDFAEPLGWEYSGDGYIAHQSHDGSDVFILLSPYYTQCAGHLLTYCFSHDWFETKRAPYRVFRVSDNTEVLP